MPTLDRYPFCAAPVTAKLTGEADAAARFLTEKTYLDRALWHKFVEQFREQPDSENHGWRGEYWGKSMRGAVTVYRYLRDERLYDVLTETVEDLLDAAEPDGRISSFRRDAELCWWDMWCRKYVMLGLQYYYGICRDGDLKARILSALCAHADYILARVGRGEGKMSVLDTSYYWRALNSCSILEPMMHLYRMTGEARYLDFASHIVEEGGARDANIFEKAFENTCYPYQYGVVKAYEMCSCFEGLLEYYEVTGDERHKTAAINFGYALLESEDTVIGSLGCTHELLDHGRMRQTAKADEPSQETCVTVTWMRYCARMLALTGDRVFADSIEKSFHNAYLGALNTTEAISPYLHEKFVNTTKETDYVVDTFLPFDSYAPLTPRRRGERVGGNQLLSDKSYFGCCACIGGAGLYPLLEQALTVKENELTLNFFERGDFTCRVGERTVRVSLETAYPVDGRVTIRVTTDAPLSLSLRVRIPAWSKSTQIASEKPYVMENGYAVFAELGTECDEIVLDLDMTLRRQLPESWEDDVIWVDKTRRTPNDATTWPLEVHHLPEDDNYVCWMRGPITLGGDSRMEKDVCLPYTFREENGLPVYRLSEDTRISADESCRLRLVFTDADGREFSLIDYASAGKDWKTVIAAWLPV